VSCDTWLYVILFFSQLYHYEDIIWDKPYSHAAAYVIGTWLGYVLHSQQVQQVHLRHVSLFFTSLSCGVL